MYSFRKGNTDVPLSRTATPGTAPWPWKRLHNSALITANKNIMPELRRDAGEQSNIQQKPMNTWSVYIEYKSLERQGTSRYI
jgi:hypothetical protein